MLGHSEVRITLKSYGHIVSKDLKPLSEELVKFMGTFLNQDK